MNDLLAAFAKEFEGDLFYDTLYKQLYATDASVYRKLPLAVAFPKNKEGIQQLIKFASENKTSLIPRTAGTSLAGQCVGEGIVVDVSKYFTQILSVDTQKKTVTVQPGVIRDELNTYLEPYGLFFGPNTSTSNRCMIGGMVGNNSSGTTSIQYGVTRDKVLSLETVLSNGEVVTFSEITSETLQNKLKLPTLEGQLYKELYSKLSEENIQQEIRKEFPKPSIHRRNTGYAVDTLLDSEAFSTESNQPFNLCKLLCGSEGTLTFTTEITVQLDDLPPAHTAMIATQYNTLDACMNDVVVAMRHNLYTCELMDDVILDCTKNNKTYLPYRFFIQGTPKAVLLLELRDTTPEGLETQIQALQQNLTQSGLSDTQTVLRGEEITLALELRKAGLGLLGNMVGDRKAVACIEDTAVALEDLPAYIKEFSALMKKFGQEAVYYAHAGAGELHLRPILNLKKKEDVALFREITTAVASLVKHYQGSFSGEHGDGIVRAEFLKGQIGEANFALLQQIKHTFDPQNIFNPGKITDAWPMDESLRTSYALSHTEPVEVPSKKQVEKKTFLNFSDSGGLLRLAEKCNGSGDCRKTEHSHGMLCPSYHATRNEKDTTRGRANVLRELLSQEPSAFDYTAPAVQEAFDLCVGCKACATECPSNVDMATAKMEVLFQQHLRKKPSRATKLLGKSSLYTQQASKYPRLANFLFRNPISSSIIKKYSGIAPQRSLPLLSIKTFDKGFEHKQYQGVKQNRSVVLFVDEFSNYLEADLAKDAFQLLSGLGYDVGLITSLDSARALLSKGFLKEAKQTIDANIAHLQHQVSNDTPLVGIEPSAILGFRDEYVRLASDVEAATHIAKHTLLIEEFLAAEAQAGRIGPQHFTQDPLTLKVHVHCHQKALSTQKVTFDILNLPLNYKPTLIPSGCCGMAGSFGYEQEHYAVSMQIGELKLLPAVRKAGEDVVIVANGTSCRHQIKDGTGREAVHPVTVLRKALVVE
ncbi:FAD-binding protein [Aureisphaera sp. CAU 1614]|uniref:FAD-binding protein n=1 Tax=Halomarinibacterium sedimenti TaxID=2857106 RepID=A0A9X1FNV6_9FLAO|nr:FAD-binding and (Fe-S)-binding domain-containing protein [Halomarinibacterium sedimenti]MBW2937881.1 FAD-binding protein [Halomarinibacterium sedimenti]